MSVMPSHAGDASQPATLDDVRDQLARILEYDESIPLDVVKAAITHPDFGRRLIASRGHCDTIRHLIARAPSPGRSETRFAFDPARRTEPQAAVNHSSAELVAQASSSLLRWAATAFRPVDEATYARRWNACSTCEHLTEPSGNVVHDLTKLFAPSAKVCGLCGCVASKKARIPHEACPATDAFDAALTRWGEPRTHVARTVDTKENNLG